MSNDKIIELSGHCKNLTGLRSGRLVALVPVGKDKGWNVLWRCRCDCGQECVVRGYNLVNGSTKSCGCLKKESASKMFRTHGMSSSATYCTWQNMISRCENPKNKKFKYYGGRGISVCTRWHKFENFLEDMGERPEGKTLDRVNNDGNYELDNCKWSTRHEQRINSRPASKGPRKQKWFWAWRSDMMGLYLSNNLHKFARDHGLGYQNIAACLHHRRKTHRGWVFGAIVPFQPDSRPLKSPFFGS